MARLYAATGDAIARLDEEGGAVERPLGLEGSGAQCLAVDPADGDMVYAGLREGGVRRAATTAARRGRTARCRSPAVFSLAVSAADGAVYAGTEPSRALPQRRRRRELARARRAARAAVAADLELPAAAVDVARALDRARARTTPDCCSSGSSSAG